MTKARKPNLPPPADLLQHARHPVEVLETIAGNFERPLSPEHRAWITDARAELHRHAMLAASTMAVLDEHLGEGGV